MKVLVVTMCKNEEKIMPFFIQHYSEIADTILLVDNGSTDNTISIARDLGNKLDTHVVVLNLDTSGFSESLKKNVYETAYRHEMFIGQYDLSIVVDTDEFLYHPHGTRKQLEIYNKKYKNNLVIKPKGYDMVSDTYPVYNGESILNQVNEGTRSHGFDKCNCFSSNLILQASMGMHYSSHFNPKTKSIVRPKTNKGFFLLHFKTLGRYNRIERQKNMRDNLNDLGKLETQKGINSHLLVSDKELLDYADHIKANSSKLDFEALLKDKS